MSMNLHCDEIGLIQTPTHVTHMCLYADLDGRAKSPPRTVAEKYLMWITAKYGNELQDWKFADAERVRVMAALEQYGGDLHFEEV